MRVAAEPAYPAVRSFAQILRRADMALPSSPVRKVAEVDEFHVNPAPDDDVLAEAGAGPQEHG